jgi:hypothetical protein
MRGQISQDNQMKYLHIFVIQKIILPTDPYVIIS